MSLNNASNRYSDLADLEMTRNGRVGWLLKAVEAVEEAARIYRELGHQGDVAMSLNNASNRYCDLADLETTPEVRGDWLRKAVNAVGEAVGIRRELGTMGELAMYLNNASSSYFALAGLETTHEGMSGWLRKALAAVGEAVRIRRELGVPGDLAISLTNVSNCYSALAGLETTPEDRGRWLRKAVEAVEEAVGIHRELGVQGDLAMSLGAACQVLRRRAENVNDHAGSLPDLRASRDAIEEAAGLFRESGNTLHFLMSLRDLVISHTLLHKAGEPFDATAVRAMCIEGTGVAESMEDEAGINFFRDELSRLG
jgi:hypothetical protein